jgi:hypothetical protein
MDYRNERDALRGRVERLEQELDEARRELAEARRREGAAEADGARAERERLQRLEAAMPEAEALIQRLRRELAAVERLHAQGRPAVQEKKGGRGEEPAAGLSKAPRRGSSKAAAAIVAVTLVAGVALSIVSAVGSRTKHRSTCDEAVACCFRNHKPGDPLCKWALDNCQYYLEHWDCPGLAPPAPAASSTQRARQVPGADFPVVDFDRPATIETWSATWSGRISRATGSAPPPGSTCAVEATLEAASAGIRLAGLTVTCGGTRLYSISGAFARARTNDAIVLKRAVAPSCACPSSAHP